jgi:hypothetical protein
MDIVVGHPPRNQVMRLSDTGALLRLQGKPSRASRSGSKTKNRQRRAGCEGDERGEVRGRGGGACPDEVWGAPEASTMAAASIETSAALLHDVALHPRTVLAWRNKWRPKATHVCDAHLHLRLRTIRNGVVLPRIVPAQRKTRWGWMDTVSVAKIHAPRVKRCSISLFFKGSAQLESSPSLTK